MKVIFLKTKDEIGFKKIKSKNIIFDRILNENKKK